ncbi:BZ3501_MvSof-1269-A2-R1_Chr3-2g06209 [Microbotryum saponariae]|nr:BZ3501_MvSof-1269-A2-R1_Chr3-2g06209 [Microbotryum saponariae]
MRHFFYSKPATSLRTLTEILKAVKPNDAPVKYSRSIAPGLNTNRKEVIHDRLRQELGGRIEFSRNLHTFVATPAPELDDLVEHVAFSGTWGEEEPMKDLFAQINAVGPAIRHIVASGFLNIVVPTSAGQLPHDDHAPDAVALFSFASTEPIERVWAMSDDEWRREGIRLGKRPEDLRQLNHVLAPGELKKGNKGGSAVWQSVRRFYRLKSANALREFTYGFTLVGSQFRVLIHSASGVFKTNEFDCSQQEGYATLLRFLVRLVVAPELDLGIIASGPTYPVTVDSLPPIIYQRPIAALSSPRLTHQGVCLWQPTHLNDAMTGPRAICYPGVFNNVETGSQASFGGSPEHSVVFSLVDQDQAERTSEFLKRVHSLQPHEREGLAVVDMIFRDPQAYRSAPVAVCGGDTGCGTVPRAVQYVKYDRRFESILEAKSTTHLTQIILGAAKGIRTLYRLNILNLDLSVDNIVVIADGTGCLLLPNWLCFLNDPSSEEERLEPVGALTTMARANLPTISPRIKQEIWHQVEQLFFIVLYVVSSRPLGPQSPKRMSKEDELDWEDWDSVVPMMEALKTELFQRPERWESRVEQYSSFWTNIGSLSQVLFKYCGITLIRERSTIAEEETALFEEWGGGTAQLVCSTDWFSTCSRSPSRSRHRT